MDGKQKEAKEAELPWSSLTMGTSTFGSRVGTSDALRALEVGFEHGIRVVDTARAYGYGESESIVGRFLKGRRDQVTVATKFGIFPSARGGKLAYLKRPARLLMGLAPGIFNRAMSLVSALRPAQTHVPFTPELVQKSVEQSLRQLDVDTIDILFFHAAKSESFLPEHRHGLWETLERMHQRGDFRYLGFSGSFEAERELREHWDRPYLTQYPIEGLSLQAARGAKGSDESDASSPEPKSTRCLGYQAWFSSLDPIWTDLEALLKEHGHRVPLRRVLLAGPLIEGLVDSVIASSSNPRHVIDNASAALDGPSEPETKAAWELIRPQMWKELINSSGGFR